MLVTDTDRFVVKRSEWSFGKGKYTKLLDDQGKKDCLGFFMLASGFEKRHLLNLDEPVDVLKQHEWHSQLIEWYGGSVAQSDVCSEIIRINDHAMMHRFDRERSLTILFQSIGVTLTFTD